MFPKIAIKKVVVGSEDPNPLVAGKGIEALRRHGVEVAVGTLEAECQKLNEVFFHYIKTNTPYVVMKYAMTMDGKIAAHTGQSKWITGEAARYNVHMDRKRYAAVMIGAGTAVKDDPLLTCRIPDGKDPVRIVCDTNLRTPLNSQILKTAQNVATIIATSCADEEKIKPYASAGCKIITVSKKDGHVNLNELMTRLGEEKIDSILLEGGGELNWSALESGIVNKVQAYIAPMIFGGISAPSPVGGCGVDDSGNAYFLINSAVSMFGCDMLIESEVARKCSQE